MVICPVCGQPLSWREHVCVCPSGHSFDRARSGYVNLLLSQQPSGRRHGDDKRMVSARTAFLETGAYRPLLDSLCAVLTECAPKPRTFRLLDVGCGEGWYTDGVRAALEANGMSVSACGLDISKAALDAAARRHPSASFFVGSVSRMPVADACVHGLLNVFAPFDRDEFRRVLAPGGLWVRAVPLERHLFGLKAAVYDRPYENEVEPPEMEGFSLLASREVRYTLRLDDPAQIQALFWMTPYAYKTGAADQAKLEALQTLETDVTFGIRAYTSC